MALLIESSLWRKIGPASPVIGYVTLDKPPSASVFPSEKWGVS